MAVYTDVAAEDLGPFLAGYDIGELLAYKGIAEGVENSNFLVHTGRGYFILTLYERRVAERDLPFFLALMEHLASRGITCPQPVKNRAGETLGRLAGRPAAIVTFLDGMWIRRPSAAHCAGLGEALARLHLAGADFPMRRENALSVAGWRQLLRACGERADDVQRDLKALLAAELDLLEARVADGTAARRHSRRPVSRQCVLPRRQAVGPDRLLLRLHRHAGLRRRHLPQRLVLRAGSFLQRDQGPRAACELRQDAAAVAGRNGRSCRCLPRGAALRFLLTRLVDWLDVPPGALVRPKDPIEYLRKLRFHQKVASVRDYGVTAP